MIMISFMLKEPCISERFDVPYRRRLCRASGIKDKSVSLVQFTFCLHGSRMRKGRKGIPHACGHQPGLDKGMRATLVDPERIASQHGLG